MASVSSDTLQKLINNGITSPYLQARMEYKEVSTLLQQHIRKMEGLKRVYPNMCSPQSSGRVGLSDPPLGNFTADKKYGPKGLRDVVQPDVARKWICPDWNAVEGWIVSHRSQDQPDLEVKRRGLDLHTVTAIRALGFEDPPGDPTKDWLRGSDGVEWRQKVGFDDRIRLAIKNVRYSAHYSKKIEVVKRYAIALGMDPRKLVQFGYAYMKSKPWLQRWKEQRWAYVSSRKEARTAFGRRRRLMGSIYQMEKEGLNHEVQGTVADMMKMTMVALGEIGCNMVLQRHDGWYSDVGQEWSDMDRYKAIVEREWIIDDRPISFPAEYEVWE